VWLMGNWDLWDVLIALSGWLAWLSKELLSQFLKHRLSRAGARGVIPIDRKIVGDVEKGSDRFEITYTPGMGAYPQYAEVRRFKLRIECQFFNDSPTPITYTDLKMRIWGVEGVRVLHMNPHVETLDEKSQKWNESLSITVPAHAVVRVRFVQPMAFSLEDAEEQIADWYDGGVAELLYKTLDGKEGSLRICRHSIAGKHPVSWLEEHTYPVYSERALNERTAGDKPQTRK